jgi:NhaP-type Na+/H+ or K+/H+ antiporter
MTYNLMLLLIGFGLLAGAVLPRFLRRTPVSMPMLYLGGGMFVPYLWSDIPRIDPIENGYLIERLSEMAVIISLMGAGLKLDRPLGWRAWASTWRLLAVTMPLCIAAMALGGIWLAGLPLAAAALLGAVTAPTDPVLASSVQVGPPSQSGKEPEVRFALTSEAGLNDGLAFPFVHLAIMLSAAGFAMNGIVDWFAVSVIWKIVAGTGVGLLIGWAVAWVVFRLSPTNAVSDGFVSLALTLVAYGSAELAHGYGFIAVFVAALTFRRFEKDHPYHQALHNFSEQLEYLFLIVLLLALGISVTQGLFTDIRWQQVALAFLLLLIIRPAAGMVGLWRSGLPLAHRLSISALGIRGIGTVYYLAYGLSHSVIVETVARELWALAAIIIILSVILHGIAAPKVMKHLD